MKQKDDFKLVDDDTKREINSIRREVQTTMINPIRKAKRRSAKPRNEMKEALNFLVSGMKETKEEMDEMRRELFTKRPQEQFQPINQQSIMQEKLVQEKKPSFLKVMFGKKKQESSKPNYEEMYNRMIQEKELKAESPPIPPRNYPREVYRQKEQPVQKSPLVLALEEEKIRRERVGVLYDERVNELSALRNKEDDKGKKNLLISTKRFIADVTMKENCIGCDYRHHIMNKEERTKVVEILNHISMLHQKSRMKRFTYDYKSFKDIECICLAKNCPYGYFHGETLDV